MGMAAPKSVSFRWQDSNYAKSGKWTSGGGDGIGLPGGITNAGPLWAADDGVAGALERSSVEGPPLGGVEEEQSWPEDCWEERTGEGPRVGLPGPEWGELWWDPTKHSFGSRWVRGFLEEPSAWFFTWWFWGSGFLAGIGKLKLVLAIWDERGGVLYLWN